uniref:Uncharacterized protein n=1 Tax=Trypanosoma congolense (strain IL3000) TaxID=1068625 RepID=G0UNC8_TRYCI|nr:hypothetical protein, unlikely [Trypanosoma congolense IL3000]
MLENGDLTLFFPIRRRQTCIDLRQSKVSFIIPQNASLVKASDAARKAGGGRGAHTTPRGFWLWTLRWRKNRYAALRQLRTSAWMGDIRVSGPREGVGTCEGCDCGGHETVRYHNGKTMGSNRKVSA